MKIALASTLVSVAFAQAPVVRLAALEIDSVQIEAYKAALKEEIEASVKGHPTQVRIFERYAGLAAYQSHIDTPHFKKYKTATQHMVKSLRLIETERISLGSK